MKVFKKLFDESLNNPEKVTDRDEIIIKFKAGCTTCPYSGHIGLKECPDAYTPVSEYCGLYDHSYVEFRRNVNK